jgi:hypothetical protein
MIKVFFFILSFALLCLPVFTSLVGSLSLVWLQAKVTVYKKKKDKDFTFSVSRISLNSGFCLISDLKFSNQGYWVLWLMLSL